METDRNIEGIDWGRSQIDVYDGKAWRKYPSLLSYANDPFNKGKCIVLEASGESFELKRRDDALDALREADIEALCYNSKYTAKYRGKNGIKKKSNKVDAQCIYLVATTTPLTLSTFKPLVEEDLLRDSIKKILVKDRAIDDGLYKTTLVSNLLKTGTPHDDLFKTKAGEYRAQVGSLLVTAEQVRKAGRGFRKFRELIGNYGSGYGSIQRSEFYQHLVMGVTNSELGRHPKKGYSTLTKKQRDYHKNVMRRLSIGAKWLWQQTA